MKKILFIILYLASVFVVQAQTAGPKPGPTYYGRRASNPNSCSSVGSYYTNSSTGFPVYCTATGTPGTWSSISGGGTVTGTGNPNNVSKWNGTSSQTNSNITDDGTTVTVNAPTLTGSQATSGLALTQTNNTTGNPTTFKIVVTDTASGSTAKPFEILGTSTGASSLFSVSKAGAVTTAGTIASGANLQTPATGNFLFTTRSRLLAPSDGQLQFTNNAQTANAQLIFGGEQPGEVNVSANYTVLISDHIICVDSTGGARTITLPSAVGSKAIYSVVDCGGASATNNITINTAGGNINGTATKVINTNNAAFNFFSDSTNYHIR